MSEFLNTVFEKFLPGWKVRITSILVFLLGVSPDQAGFLALLGVDVPAFIYSFLYGFGLLGVGEKLEAVKMLLKAKA